MKNLILTTIVAFTTYVTAYGQSYIYIGDNRYEATNSWKFEMNGTYYQGDTDIIELTVAKRSNGGGYLIAAIDILSESNYIGGLITVFLSNGSVIKCTDKGVRDYVDNQSIAIYNFTNSEIKLLRSFRIMKIRFSIKGGLGDGQAFTADNEKLVYNTDQENYYKTDVEISKLFN